ncbi:hypothetical protein [Flavobacterium crocinum]|uniref:hypothetical protein n=1 Tax=Flavobacterium crocinum TaxID=2183896 RepID=UPI001F0C9D6F|nr:hypothetical protein [Flavobacterium crocinum]
MFFIIRKDESFVNYYGIDELMVTSPIFDHQAKLKGIQITKEAIDNLNESIHI